MATKDYKLGWKYYAEFTELRLPNYTYIHLPVNSTFALPSDFRMAVANIFWDLYYYIFDPNSFTVSGYDMSVEGEQQLTISYTCPNGQVLTSTEVKLIVFGTSTWRTVWSGNTTISYDYGKFTIDGVEHKELENAYICTPADDKIFLKYVGRDHIRKLRITCSVDGYNPLYIGDTERTHGNNVLQSYEFDFNYKKQRERPVGAGGTDYFNVYKTIAVKDPYGTSATQMIAGHIDAYGIYNNGVLTNSLMCFDYYWEKGGDLSASSSLNLTITKIEVQE